MDYPITASDREVAEKLRLAPHVPRDWRLRKSVPAQHWLALVQARFATFDQLAKYAAEQAKAPSKPAPSATTHEAA